MNFVFTKLLEEKGLFLYKKQCTFVTSLKHNLKYSIYRANMAFEIASKLIRFFANLKINNGIKIRNSSKFKKVHTFHKEM